MHIDIVAPGTAGVSDVMIITADTAYLNEDGEVAFGSFGPIIIDGHEAVDRIMVYDDRGLDASEILIAGLLEADSRGMTSVSICPFRPSMSGSFIMDLLSGIQESPAVRVPNVERVTVIDREFDGSLLNHMLLYETP